MVPVLAQLKAVLIKASGPDSATRSRGRVEKSLGDGVYVISSSDGKMTVQVKEKSLALHGTSTTTMSTVFVCANAPSLIFRGNIQPTTVSALVDS